MNKELKITPPEGYEIDKEKSTLEHIVFKPVDKKAKTWKEIHKLNVKNKILFTSVNTERQGERIRALSQLYTIADYYNNGWEADWNNLSEDKYVPYWDNLNNKIDYYIWTIGSHTTPPFKSKELMIEAYENNKEIFETALKS